MYVQRRYVYHIDTIIILLSSYIIYINFSFGTLLSRIFDFSIFLPSLLLFVIISIIHGWCSAAWWAWPSSMIGPAVGSPTVAAAVRGQRTVAAAPGEPRAYITAAPSDPRARCMELPPPPPHRTRTGRPVSCAPPPVCRGVGRVVPRSADRAQSPPPPLPQNSSSSEPHYGEQFKANGPRSHVVIAAVVLSLSVVVACHMRRLFVGSFPFYYYIA